MSIEVKKHLWSPTFKNQIWITDKRPSEEFIITLKKNDDVEIEFSWDHGYGGGGASTMHMPLQMLKDLIKEIEES